MNKLSDVGALMNTNKKQTRMNNRSATAPMFIRGCLFFRCAHQIASLSRAQPSDFSFRKIR